MRNPSLMKRVKVVETVPGDEHEHKQGSEGPSLTGGRMPSQLFSDSTYTVGGLVEDIDKGEVALPDIQRPFVWTPTRPGTCSTRCIRASRWAISCSGAPALSPAPVRSAQPASK